MPHAAKSTGYTKASVYLAARDRMTAGHRQQWMMEILNAGRALSTDARLLLCILVGHHGQVGRVFPGLRRLSTLAGMSVGRCMAARDELKAAGLIEVDLGTGTRSSQYHLVALERWFAERHPASRSVPDSSPSVPDSRSSVHPVETKPSNPENKKEADPPGPPPVPAEVPAAPPVTDPLKKLAEQAVQAAPDAGKILRDHWLPGVTWIGEDAGIVSLRCATEYQRDGLEKRKDPLDVAARALGFDGVRILGPVNRPNLRPIT